MEVVKKILKNKWFMFGISLLSVLYLAFIIWVDVTSFKYQPDITSMGAFVAVYSLINIFFLLVMAYTRKCGVTVIVSLILVPAMIPIVFLNLDTIFVIIPPAVVALFLFFTCKASETFKTILGTVYLLGYILLSLAFFLVVSLFIPQTTDNLLMTGYSEDKTIRYEVIENVTESTSRIQVYFEPNDMDKKYPGVTCKPVGYRQIKYNKSEKDFPDIPKIEFKSNEVVMIDGKRCDLAEWKWSFNYDFLG